MKSACFLVAPIAPITAALVAFGQLVVGIAEGVDQFQHGFAEANGFRLGIEMGSECVEVGAEDVA